VPLQTWLIMAVIVVLQSYLMISQHARAG